MALSLQDFLELGVVSECKSTCSVAHMSPSSQKGMHSLLQEMPLVPQGSQPAPWNPWHCTHGDPV